MLCVHMATYRCFAGLGHLCKRRLLLGSSEPGLDISRVLLLRSLLDVSYSTCRVSHHLQPWSAHILQSNAAQQPSASAVPSAVRTLVGCRLLLQFRVCCSDCAFPCSIQCGHARCALVILVTCNHRSRLSKWTCWGQVRHIVSLCILKGVFCTLCM